MDVHCAFLSLLAISGLEVSCACFEVELKQGRELLERWGAASGHGRWAVSLTECSSLAGLVHRDLRLGDLPPQSFHSLSLAQSGPFLDGGLRYSRDRLLGSVCSGGL